MLRDLVVETRNFEKEDDTDYVLTPRDTDVVWVIEEPLIDMYMLLVHRISGIGLSLDDFWKMDTWVLSKLYLTEIDLIEYENRQMKGKSNPEQFNDPATEDLYYSMFGED